MKNFKEEIKLLKILENPIIKKSTKKSLIKRMGKETINNIAELILNILNGNIHVSEETKNKLRPFAKICRKFLDKKTNFKTKKNILINKGIIQKGGFLQFLIPAIITGITSIITSIINNNNTKAEE